MISFANRLAKTPVVDVKMFRLTQDIFVGGAGQKARPASSVGDFNTGTNGAAVTTGESTDSISDNISCTNKPLLRQLHYTHCSAHLHPDLSVSAFW